MNARILLVDDHEVVREGLKFLLSGARPEWEISGEASTGTEAIEQTKMLKPDVVLLDISMPGMSGLEASSRMRKLGLSCPILIFTTHQSESLGNEVRQAGAQGVVAKSQAFRDLVRAIDTVLAGGTFFDTPRDEAKQKEPKWGLTYRVGLRLALGWQ
ncbi:MAG TPA: response regulator transcription factor [Candidatus Acidoferrales bacterium]|nr:response regulator transcription factor [Candidatus Acidoferrales bacterium]